LVSVLVIADLTRGTGRFNLTLGTISTAVGIGAALSQVIAGSIVHHAGFRAGFLFLAGVALAAFSLLYFFMPETRNTRRKMQVWHNAHRSYTRRIRNNDRPNGGAPAPME
jgi:MFS family permease